MSSRYFTIDQTALMKVLLHSLKYPTTELNGILVGEERDAPVPPSEAEPSPRAQTRRVLHIYDAIPVCHNYLALTHILEAALAQVAHHVKMQKNNLRIVGYYQCNERLQDVELGNIGKRIADKVEALFPGSVAVTLDGPALAALLKGAGSKPAVQLLHKDGSRGWVTAAPSGPGARLTCPAAGVADLLTAYVEEGRHRRLVDFEDHLDNIAADWLNPDLLA